MGTRYAHLDGLRGIAALIVVSLHGILAFDFGLYTGLPADSHGAWDIKISGLPFLLPLAGDYAVCLFFALSGFVLAHSFSRTNLGASALIVKRYARLCLPILAACLFSWVLLASGLTFNHDAARVIGSTWLDSQMQQEPDLLTALRDGLYGSLLALPHATSYDRALWTMGIEFMGSLLMIMTFALLRPLRERRGARNWAAGVFLLLGLVGHSFFLGLFAIGAAIYLADVRAWLERIPRPGLVMLPVLILGLFLGSLPYSAARPPYFDTLASHALVAEPNAWQFAFPAWLQLDEESFWHAVGALLTLLAAESWAPLRRLLSLGLPRFLGRISFPLYLVHLPILMSFGCGMFLLYLEAGLGFSTAAALSVGAFYLVALLVAWASTPLIETRAVAWANIGAAYAQRTRYRRDALANE